MWDYDFSQHRDNTEAEVVLLKLNGIESKQEVIMWINLERQDLEAAIRHLRKEGRASIAKRLAKQLSIFARHEDNEATAIHKAARSKYHSEGTVEIDPSAVVSEGEDGAYVMAWLWVGRADIELEPSASQTIL